MKQRLFLFLLLISGTSFAQVKIGEAVPELHFNTVLNAPVKTASLSGLQGKFVLLEFWATWCGSCLEVMPHLKDLQSRYSKKLQVIAVTDETENRTAQYIRSRPANFWFASDTSGAIASVFPHQLIPHSVLISPRGKLLALTSPELLTNAVMDSLVNGQSVNLAEKKDRMLNYEELIRENFIAADTVQRRFMMQGEIKGAPGLSDAWLASKIFSGRRLSCFNLSLASLYAIAYGNFPYARTDNKTSIKGAPLFCLDIIAKTPGELLPDLRAALAERFDLQAKVTLTLKKVQVLRIFDLRKFQSLQRNISGKRSYYARHGEIDQQAISMKDFASFLESYGVNKLVTDETGNQEKFDIKFSFQPENPQSLKDILKEMGLSLTEEKRNVDILTIYNSAL